MFQESSGANKHCLDPFNWINLKMISVQHQYHRSTLRESLEIQKEEFSKKRNVLNHGERIIVKTNTWNSITVKLVEKIISTVISLLTFAF